MAITSSILIRLGTWTAVQLTASYLSTCPKNNLDTRVNQLRTKIATWKESDAGILQSFFMKVNFWVLGTIVCAFPALGSPVPTIALVAKIAIRVLIPLSATGIYLLTHMKFERHGQVFGKYRQILDKWNQAREERKKLCESDQFAELYAENLLRDQPVTMSIKRVPEYAYGYEISARDQNGVPHKYILNALALPLETLRLELRARSLRDKNRELLRQLLRSNVAMRLLCEYDTRMEAFTAKYDEYDRRCIELLKDYQKESKFHPPFYPLQQIVLNLQQWLGEHRFENNQEIAVSRKKDIIRRPLIKALPKTVSVCFDLYSSTDIRVEGRDSAGNFVSVKLNLLNFSGDNPIAASRLFTLAKLSKEDLAQTEALNQFLELTFGISTKTTDEASAWMDVQSIEELALEDQKLFELIEHFGIVWREEAIPNERSPGSISPVATPELTF